MSVFIRCAERVIGKELGDKNIDQTFEETNRYVADNRTHPTTADSTHVGFEVMRPFYIY